MPIDDETLKLLNQQIQANAVASLGEPPPPQVQGPVAPKVPVVAPEMAAEAGGAVGTPAAPSIQDQLLKGLQMYQVPLMQLGTSLMRGRNTMTGAPTETAGSQIGGILAGTASALKMNEALKKMVATQLGGGGKGFNEGQPVGLESADVAGLTPEQISGLYGTGIALREKELERPFKNLATLSESYLKIMSGEAKPAEMQQHLANAQKVYQELAVAPVKNWVDLQTKLQAMDKVKVEIEEVKARTVTEKEKPVTAKVERKKTEAQTAELEAKLDPRQVRLLEFARTAGGQVKISDAGDRLIVTDPATGKEIGSFSVGAKPEGEAKKAAQELPLKKFAMQRVAPLMIPHIQAEMIAQPGGKRQVELQNLISSLRSIGTGEIDPSVVIAKLSPADQTRFNKAMDIYIRNPQLSETELGDMMRVVLGTPQAAPAEKPGEKKSIIEKNRPTPFSLPQPKTAAAPSTAGRPEMLPEQFNKQLTGKPAGIYESGTHRVKWDGTNVTSIEQKPAAKAAPPINFGTY